MHIWGDGINPIVGSALMAYGGIIVRANCSFEGTWTSHFNSSSGKLEIYADTTINGVATNSVVSASSLGTVASSMSANGGINPVIYGNATGVRYRVTGNSVISTNGGGATYFPGDQNGVLGSGGQYT